MLKDVKIRVRQPMSLTAGKSVAEVKKRQSCQMTRKMGLERSTLRVSKAKSSSFYGEEASVSARKWEFGFHSRVCATQACHMLAKTSQLFNS